jgi:hypothetical protein
MSDARAKKCDRCGVSKVGGEIKGFYSIGVQEWESEYYPKPTGSCVVDFCDECGREFARELVDAIREHRDSR